MKLRAVLVALALLAAACGPGGAGGEDGGLEAPGGTIVHGTTERPATFDPAGARDPASWNVIYNVFNGLLRIPPGKSVPEPDLADECHFVDPRTYRCDLKKGVQFHDGSPFTSQDVVFSFQRVIEIDDPRGPCALLAALAACGEWMGDEIETPTNETVTFRLRRADARWPYVLATAAGAIVSSRAYSSQLLQPAEEAAGTGAYRLDEHRLGDRTILKKNLTYFGSPALNDEVVIRYYRSSASLARALAAGDVDIATRTLRPSDVEVLRQQTDVKVIAGRGGEISYLVFNLRSPPFNKVQVRRAVAHALEREQIAEDVYEGAVEPLFSPVPSGLQGHVPAFVDEYGRSPDVLAVENELTRAGVSTPLPIEIWWTPSQFGSGAKEEYAEIERTLENTALFDVNLRSADWSRYRGAALGGGYPAFQFGWRGAYPDPDSYLAPLYPRDPSFLNNRYRNKRLERLVLEERAQVDPQRRAETLEEIQRIIARDAPVVPIWQAKQIAAVRAGISGVERSFDHSLQLRYWLVTKE